MRIGSAFYPEHWPDERLSVDVSMMADAGMGIVRVAEFAWTLMEPEPGVFEFEWLDRALAALNEKGIAAIIGTPTSAPPKWLMDRHPESYPYDRFGHRKGYGHRDYYTVNAPVFWPYVDRLVERMAEHFRSTPNVVGWQIDNEIGGSGSTLSYGEQDRLAFIEWLRRRYATIDELNEAWGTRFSNQVYTDFDQIIVPAYGAIDLHNPGLELDFRRFSSDAAIAFVRRQADIIRRIIPGAVVSTNFLADFLEIDYFALARELDIVAMGAYPNCNPTPSHRPSDTAFYHDTAYGYGGGRDYWMAEHQSGTPGSTTLKPSPAPGDIGRWSAQSFAHGSQIILYFRWRSCVFGVEQYWHGILPHSGRPNRRLAEVSEFTATVRSVESVVGSSAVGSATDAPATENPYGLPNPPLASRPKARVALILSHDNAWVFDVQPHAEGHRYAAHVRSFYRALWERNIAVDMVSPDASLDGYAVAIAPNLAIVDTPAMKRPLSERLTAFVQGGGTFICDFRSGSRTATNRMGIDPAPGPLADLLGVEVLDYGILESPVALADRHANANTFVARDWWEEVQLHGAEMRLHYTDGYRQGTPAVTSHTVGSGSAWYVSTVLDPSSLSSLLASICDDAGVEPTLVTPIGVEATARIVGGTKTITLVNHTEIEQTVSLPEPFRRTIHPAAGRADEIRIAPRGFAVIAESLETDA